MSQKAKLSKKNKNPLKRYVFPYISKYVRKCDGTRYQGYESQAHPRISTATTTTTNATTTTITTVNNNNNNNKKKKKKKKKIDKTKKNSSCRLCGDSETINHMKSKTSRLTQRNCKTRSDWVGKVTYWELCKNLNLTIWTNPSWKMRCRKFFWILRIPARRPDQVIVQKKKKKKKKKNRTCRREDLDLAEKLWNMKVMVISIVIPGDLRRLGVTQTPVKDHQLTCEKPQGIIIIIIGFWDTNGSSILGQTGRPSDS